jgi:hypothetical protein
MKINFKILASTFLVVCLIFNFIEVLFGNSLNQNIVSLYKADPATITSAIIQFVIVTAISYLLAPKPPSRQGQQESQGFLVNKDSNNNPIPVVYGNRQLGIIKTFVESSGSDNKYLYFAGVLCEGGGAGITSIDEIYVDDKLVIFDGALTDGTLREVSDKDKNFYKSGSLISIQAFYGLDNQPVSSLLNETTNWTSDHKLSGLAYVALRFKFNQDIFGGTPQVRVTLKGKKIYDPRLDSTKGGSGSHRQDDATTWAYSANSSLILLDYLRNTRYGKGVPNDAFETNYESFKTSANTADAEVVAVESTASNSAGLRLENYTDYFNDNLNHFKSRSLNTDLSTQLDGAINNSVTTITVNSTTNFASSGKIKINSEIISYTGKTEPTEENPAIAFTGCVRGIDGTTATSHLDNDRVSNLPDETITSIDNVTTQEYKSKLYYGYFNPITTGSYLFKTTSERSSLLYIGTAGQEISSLFNTLENAPTFNHSSISTYLKVNNSGIHNSATVESSGVSMVSGQSYPVILYHGTAKNTASLTFQWKLSGGTYSTVLSARFTDGLASDLKVPLFQTNAVLDSEQKLIDNVRQLLVPMRAIFNYIQGKYKVIIEGTGSSQLLLTKDNVVSEVKMQGESKSDKFNRVIGTFANPKKDFQDDTVSYPPYDDSNLAVDDQHATMLTEDNETLLEKTVDMKQVTSPYQAEEICENILKRSRNNLKAEVTATAEALNLSIGDIVTATYDTAGFSAKPFRVMSLSINSDSTVNLGLEEHQDNFYTYEGKGEEPTIPDTVLPDPFEVQAPASITLSDQLIQYSDGVVITALDVTIVASVDDFVDYYQVEYKLSTDTDFLIHAQGTGLNQRILNVKDGFLYNVRVKAVNTLGVSSTYTSASRTIIGGIAPPSDVEDFACNIIGGDAHLSWSQISDLDLAYYQIRFSTLTTGASWANSVSLVEKVARPATSVTVPARVGSYLIKAVDKNGNLSSNETIIATNVVAIGNYNAVATQTESPTFLGTKTNVFLDDDDNLRLDSSELFDSAIGNFDDATGFFDSGLTAFDLYSEGTYLFANPVDIGGVYTTRVTASITQSSDNLDDLFDARTGNFDDAGSNFDGDTPANCNAHLEIALSDDNITYTSFRNFVVGDYTARYYKFRLTLSSFDLSSTPVISALSVSIDAPDRIFSGNDLTSGAGTYTVTFTNPFYSANYAVGITAQSLGTGNFYEITSKTISSFGITFRNSGGTAISKNFDFLAKGY